MDDYIYKELDKDEQYRNLQMISNRFDEYLKDNNLSRDDIIINIPLVIDMIIRVDKSKAYFKIFHNNMRISELKEASLYCYWILKHKPFSMKKLVPEKITAINEGFAIYIIFCAISEKLMRENKKALKLPDEYIKDLLYSFKYRELSEEAIMLITESLGIAANYN